MIHKTYWWKTKDRKKLFAQCWKPDEESKKTILLVHGLIEHSGRYERWANLFVEKGFNFLSFDLRGHGKSGGKSLYAKSIEVLMDDIDLAYNKANELFPETKLILYGHSMGGTLVLNHIILRNRPVDAMIVSSPWLKLPKEPSPAIQALAAFASRYIPRLRIRTGLNPDNRSHDPQVIREFENDPLIKRKPTIRLVHFMYNAARHASRNVYKINYPFLLMHGTEDITTSPKASENYVRNTTSRTRLKLWEGQYHELHNELIYKEIFDYIIEWLESHGIK